jgi:PP-loop superfamily ATP-utilizing enzyme
VETKLAQLKFLLKELGAVLVAYSGGVYSTFVASLHHKILDGRALAELSDLGYTYVTPDITGHRPAGKKGSHLDRASLTLLDTYRKGRKRSAH